MTINYKDVLINRGILWAPMYSDVQIPQHSEPGAAGMDVRAYLGPSNSGVDGFHNERMYSFNEDDDRSDRILIETDDKGRYIEVKPTARVIIPTGLRFVCHQNLELQLRPRSSYIKHTLRMVNAPGTLDSTYRGEIGILLENISHTRTQRIYHGERIAQAVLAPYTSVMSDASNTIPYDDPDSFAQFATSRGAGAFGSTGKQ